MSSRRVTIVSPSALISCGAVLGTLLGTVLGTLPAGPAVAAGASPTVTHLHQIDRQDVPSTAQTEADTVAEPDVAVSPLDPKVAVAAVQDGRLPLSGSRAISVTWTHDGGKTWTHSPLPKLTTATGGTWDRASDPVVAFGPQGDVYVTSLLLMDKTCPSAIGVSRSTDGGTTFGAPVLAHLSTTCAVGDDKPWITVDRSATSPHRGRIYQFWTAFLTAADGPDGTPQWMRYSDDRGAHWSATVTVTGAHDSSQNSQPLVRPNGTVVDVYSNTENAVEAKSSTTPSGAVMQSTVSTDGGLHWSKPVIVTTDIGVAPDAYRCCETSATIDPATGTMFTVFPSATHGLVKLSSSVDGVHWSTPVQVNHDATSGLDQVNYDVTAYGGKVFVSYGTADPKVHSGRYVQQEVASSYDNGRHFTSRSIGPQSDTHYAAFAHGAFPGDYIGSAAAAGTVYLVWCRSSTPPAGSTSKYHQVLLGATLTP